VVTKSDGELLVVTDSFLQFVCFFRILSGAVFNCAGFVQEVQPKATKPAKSRTLKSPLLLVLVRWFWFELP
jgi:hypothetical protein